MNPVEVSRWKGEAAIGLLIAAFGAAWLVMSRTIPFLTEGRPGAGFAPITLGLSCIVLGIVNMIWAYARRAEGEKVKLGERTAALTTASLLISVLAFEPLGFVPSTLFLLASLFWVVGQVRPVRALAVAVACTFFVWLLFVKALGVGLPVGIMPF